MRLAPLAVLLLAAGCREAPREITSADLQGDWVRVSQYVEYQVMGFDNAAFTIQGDSVYDPSKALFVFLDSTRAGAWTPLVDSVWMPWTLSADTLIHSFESGEWQRYVRLPAHPRTPRPERLAIRFGGCMFNCPVMDAEIDSSGTFWVLEGDDVEPLGRYVAHDQRVLYDRLSTLAAGLRLDQPHPAVGSEYDALSTLLVAWYDGEPHSFDGTASEFGPLLLVVAEMATAAWTLPMDETTTRHHFASRDALDYRFLSHPEVKREVFGEVEQTPSQQIAAPEQVSRLLAPPSSSLPGFLGDLAPR